MQKVLFLAAWYPVRFDAMIGLFVKRHAEIVALQRRVAVLHITADDTNQKIIELYVQQINRVFTVIVYYKNVDTGFLLLNRLCKAVLWLWSFFRGIRIVIRQFGRPHCIHVHVLTLRLGMMAYWLSRIFRVPYFITEHSSYFLPEKNVQRNWVWTGCTRWITHKSQGVSAVSQRLKEAMQTRGYSNKHFVVIRNVVPDIFFQVDLAYRPKDKIVFSNITCFDDRVKNISGLVRTVARLREQRQDFELRLIGTGPDKPAIENLVLQLNLSSHVHFTGLLFDHQLVEEITLADFTVLFSHYETMAVVIAESLACGRPVVATRAGGIHELVGDANGLLVEPGNEDDLLRQLLQMMDTYKKYNPVELRNRAFDMFSTQSVSHAFEKFYSLSHP